MKKLFTLGPQVHGQGPVTFAWQPNGLHVASVGEGHRNLCLWDRRGMPVNEVQLKSPAKVLQLEWDRDGEILAILQKDEPAVMLWRHAEKDNTLQILEMNSKDPTFLAWSKVGPQLVIGTARGNLTIYNKRTLKKQAIMGKHSKRITCGAWHPLENMFSCGSEDKTVTISGEDGESVVRKDDADDHLRMKNEPSKMLFADVKGDNPNDSYREKMVSVVNGDVTLLLINMRDPHKPTELAFQARYGNIKAYCWYGDQYLIIGFSMGFVVIISSQMRDVYEETSSVKYHQNSLDCLCCSKAACKVASAGDDGIRIISMKDFKENPNERIQIRPEARVTHMHWSDDGDLLSFCTDAGWVYCYLAKLTTLSAACNTRLAYLTSLQEMTITDCVADNGNRIVLQTHVEPAIVALGPQHLATAFNNRVWFYACTHQGGTQLINEQEYPGTVDSVSLNATHACILIAGRVSLHPIDGGDGKTILFPRKDGDGTITCCSLVGTFLIYAHNNGRLQYYSLADGEEVNEYKHENGIRRCFPNQEGTRCVIQDMSGYVWLYNPVNDDCIPIPDFPSTADRILWDTVDSSVFVAVDSNTQNLFTFVYTQVEVGGSGVRCLGDVDLGPDGSLRIKAVPTPLAAGNVSVLVVDGTAWCQQSSGQLTQQRLRSHELFNNPMQLHDNVERQRVCFRQALTLNRFQFAFKLGLALNARDLWMAMGRRCLECLDIGWAKKAYRQAPAPGMVLFLDNIQIVEDKQLLSGHVSGLLGNFGKAREYFLQSCCPEAALDMHCDFLQWEQALSLAQTLAPHRLPEIFLRSAMQLESRSEPQQALTHYEQALRGHQDQQRHDEEHLNLCSAGIARTAIRLGEIARGMDEAKKLKDPTVCKECAQSLQKMRQYIEAAQMYQEAGAYDQAASLYIQEKNFDAADALMSKIHTPKLLLQYAKAKEKCGYYREASVAYERARDFDSVVRLSLENLNEPQKAFQQVRETHLASGAARVADYCVKQGNIAGAVEFLLLAQKHEQAFQLAERHDEMSTFEAGLGEKGTRQQHTAIAKYYEQRAMLPDAARHYALCEEYQMALKLYLKVGEKEIDRAIEVVGKARNDTLTHQLIDYLMGESHDNVPKAPIHVYRLHKALGNHVQAAGTALIIAKQEQEMGNYKHAHQLLFRTYQDLKGQKVALPQELWRRLMILHSYVIVKRLVKGGDHAGAARMLLRVARNIQQFPAHIVPILTSVVIESQRAKMTAEAYKYACDLMRPEYRSQISEQYKKKIENIVRKPPQEDGKDTSEFATPCMYCAFSIPESQLDCPNCKNISPFCIITGMRMLRDDWTYCPSCHFPARHTAFAAVLEGGDGCPMCDATPQATDLPVVTDASSHIADYKSLFQTADAM